MTRRTKIVLGFAATALVAAGVIWAGFNRSVVNKKRLIGTWMLVSGGNSWGETTLTFAEDGKMKTTVQWDRETYDSEGTYKVKGDTIEMFIADGEWGDWDGKDGGEWGDWGNGNGKDGGGKSDKLVKDAKSDPQPQPKQPKEPRPRRVTIRSLTDAELIFADDGGRKTIYARK